VSARPPRRLVVYEPFRSIFYAPQFVALYDDVADLPADAFTRVWSTDPGAYLWVHRAFDLTAACVGGAPPARTVTAYARTLGVETLRAALARHLDDFKGLALAAHLAAGRDCRLTMPWTVQLPWAIPATAYSIEGDGVARLSGFVAGAVEIATADRRLTLVIGDSADASGANDRAPRIRASPVVHRAGCEIRLQPHAFHLPGIEDAAPILAAGIDYQVAHRGDVEEALAVVERFHAESFADMRDFLHVIALKPLRAGGFTNLTHSDLPGAFIAGMIANPWELADTFIHEMAHGRLFALEDGGTFFDETACDPLTDDRYYSPWRDDPRPLRGVLHGVYVYVPVCVYWQRVLASGVTTGDMAAYALDRVLRIQAQLELALAELDAHAVANARGRELLACLRAELNAIRDASTAASRPDDAPALVCEVDRELLCRWPLGGQSLATPDDPSFELHLPAGAAEKFSAEIADIPADKWVSWRRHRVEAGEVVALPGFRLPLAVRPHGSKQVDGVMFTTGEELLRADLAR
jgi:HEXXH motif-containing protein